jgi:glyoxylase-like metal-dependent hydrolase (beta-lactamase superfamily II)
MANYVYIIGDPATRKAAVVDPAWNIDGIIDLVQRDGYEIDKILITHYHADHLGGDIMGQHIEGAAEMLGKVKAKLYLQKSEAPLTKRQVGLSPTDMVVVEGGDTTEVGNLTIKFSAHPGAYPGSQCSWSKTISSRATRLYRPVRTGRSAGRRSGADVLQSQPHAAQSR